MAFSNKTILLTGGSAGIGLTMAKKFIELGNKVIVTGRSEDKLAQVASEVSGLETIRCDAANVDDIANMAAVVKEKYSDLDVLINNAGIMLHKNLAHTGQDLTALTTEVEINVSGPIRTISALMETLIANKGTIINVSSSLAYVPMLSAPIYCATKAAVHSYTVSLRTQLEPHGVRVVELMPPAVKTELTSDFQGDSNIKLITTDELIAAFIKGLEAGNDEIKPGQAKALYLMSRIAPSMITAQLAKSSKNLIPS